MLCKVKIDDFDLAIDPETNFWSIYESEIPEEILKLHESLNEELRKKMERYRFEVDFNTVYVNPTERCNANCPYCYIPEKVRKRGKRMAKRDLESYLQTFAKIGVKNIIFHGAEPLLMKEEIFELIEDHIDLSFGIQTNGFLLTEEDVEFLKRRKVNVGVSFDSPVREVEDFLRGEGHFDKVIEVIDYFNGYRRFNIITTITKFNCSQLSELIDLLAGKVRVVLMNPVRGTSEGGRELREDQDKAVNEFIKAVERAIWHTKNGRRIVIGDFANIMLGIVAPYSRILQCDISPCGGGRRFFALTPDGIFPCSEFVGIENFKIPLEVLEDPVKLRESLGAIRVRFVEKIEECKDCVYRNICGSPCPAEVYAEKGSLFSKSPYCEFYKKVIEHAFRVIRRGDLENVVELGRMKKVYEVRS
ncbi:MAG: peptide-modifying radical SAM enzyme CbpB [Archaeoglobaceae archaeon]|nr:peptide-modifying radical SAM enzyme CbpB [Archaeoglobaceae archaeon]MDW8128385.1 peptide-modifying radical SAM enzyme CbpB [Archaeoglobaceae archaeon]